MHVECFTTEYSGHDFKLLLKGKSFACITPLFTSLHKGANTARSQYALDMLLSEDCPHHGSIAAPLAGWDGVDEKEGEGNWIIKNCKVKLQEYQ